MITTFDNKQKIVLFDADSLIFSSCCSKKENENDTGFLENIDDAINKFDEIFMSIINHLEDIYELGSVITFSASKGNFRKFLNKKYKANRNYNNLPPLLNELNNYVKEQYNSLFCYGAETDDLVATYWFNLTNIYGKDNVIIVSIDKDYKQFPCIMYNYHIKHKEIYYISEEEAIYNFYEQMIVGDTADNVNYCKGYGKKFAERYFKDCKSKYQYSKETFKLFKKIYKNKAREKYIECFNLLKLRTDIIDLDQYVLRGIL